MKQVTTRENGITSEICRLMFFKYLKLFSFHKIELPDNFIKCENFFAVNVTNYSQILILFANISHTFSNQDS